MVLSFLEYSRILSVNPQTNLHWFTILLSLFCLFEYQSDYSKPSWLSPFCSQNTHYILTEPLWSSHTNHLTDNCTGVYMRTIWYLDMEVFMIWLISLLPLLYSLSLFMIFFHLLLPSIYRIKILRTLPWWFLFCRGIMDLLISRVESSVTYFIFIWGCSAVMRLKKKHEKVKLASLYLLFGLILAFAVIRLTFNIILTRFDMSVVLNSFWRYQWMYVYCFLCHIGLIGVLEISFHQSACFLSW